MNSVVLKGNLTRDPELKHLESGVSVCNFTLAVNRHFKTADGAKNKETTFVDCEAWDTGASTIAEYCKKGSPLLISGTLKLDSWEVEGQKRSKLKVRVTSFELLYNKADSGVEADTKSSSKSSSDDLPDPASVDDDIPF